jgi:hypothetical protein
VGSAGYNLSVLLHIVCVIVAYGALTIDWLSVSHQQRFHGAEAYAVAQVRYTTTIKVATRFLYGVPVFGVFAVLLSKGDISLAEAWISAALGVWIVTIAVLHGMVVPARRQMLLLLGELAGRSDDAMSRLTSRLGTATQKAARGQALISLLTVVALVLMIWKPGH